MQYFSSCHTSQRGYKRQQNPLLQIHQAKALKDLHEGGHDLAVLHELRAAMDLTLRATNMTTQSLDRAMFRTAISGCV